MTIFTRIAKGEIPSYKVAESEDFYAFLDISPLAEGHTLVIPKNVEDDYIFNLDEPEGSRALQEGWRSRARNGGSPYTYPSRAPSDRRRPRFQKEAPGSLGRP